MIRKIYFLFVLAALVSCTNSVSEGGHTNPDREYVIVVHGGAGTIAGVEKDSLRAAQYYAALDSALMIGNNVVTQGGDGVAAVIAVINYFEGNPLFNSGKGATVTSEGTFELDACIMEGKDLSAGAVAGVKTVKHPINAAYAVKTKTEHVMLTGSGADAFAKEQGLEIVDNSYFATPKTLAWIERLKKQSKKNGTVGCVVLDKDGNLVAGTSTGGMLNKKWGRVGDAPIVGAGTYADNNSIAVSCTGHGEYFIRHAVAFNLSARYKYLGESIEQAANHIIYTDLNSEAGNGGLVAVDKYGNIAMPFNSTGMYRGYLYKEKGSDKIEKRVGIGETLVDPGQSNEPAFANVDVEQFKELLGDESVVLLDARTEKEFEDGHIQGAKNIDFYSADFVEQVKNSIPDNSTIAIYCRSGKRSASAADKLSKEGYKVVNLLGGYLAWSK